MMIRYRILIVLASHFLLFHGTVNAQFELTGQFRTRFEYRDGYKKLSTAENFPIPIVFQRSRLVANFNNDGLTFRFSGQDARVWGQNSTNIASNTTHIHEAWVKYNITQKVWFKIGRQELKYDDQRLLASNDYSLTGITYDAAVIAIESKESKTMAHLGAMINNSKQDIFLTYYDNNLFKYMAFSWFSKTFNESISISAINVFDLTQKNSDPHIMYGRNTAGINTVLSFSEMLGLRVGGYYQFGKTWQDWGDGNFQKITVKAYSFNTSLWVKPITNLNVSFNVDMYSGHDWSRSTETFTSFHRLLSAGHALLGFMDYFTTKQLSEVGYAGIYNYFVCADFRITPKANFQATVHNFRLDKSFMLNAGTLYKVNKNMGTEVDLVFGYKVSKVFYVEGAWMFITPTKTLEMFNYGATGISKFSHFGYISLLFTPNFFKYSMPSE